MSVSLLAAALQNSIANGDSSDDSFKGAEEQGRK
jgi:hypothetical protein